MNQYEDLKNQITLLKEKRERLNQLLLSDLSKLYELTESPAPFVKKLTSELAADGDFKKDLLKIGLNFGSAYLAKILHRGGKDKSLLTQLLSKLGL